MEVSIENLGMLDEANLKIGDLTIICGDNNTGKTYITYAMYGFLKLLFGQSRYDSDDYIYRFKDHLIRHPVDNFSAFVIKLIVSPQDIKSCLEDNDGTLEISIAECQKRLKKFFDVLIQEYTDFLPTVFGSKEQFQNVKFEIQELETIELPKDFKKEWQFSKSSFNVTCERKEGQEYCLFNFIGLKKNYDELALRNVCYHIQNYFLQLYSNQIYNDCNDVFIASAERTGAAIFQKELHFARNRLFDRMKVLDDNDRAIHLFREHYTDYALPVKENVDFIRNLDSITKNNSYLKDDPQYADILKNFSKILKGKYKIDKTTAAVKFVPTKKKIKSNAPLSMGESSSTVRSLLDINFYLQHVAQKGDILMVDEPELNLHPNNQRLIARLFAQLINSGLKIFITTHSDFLIKELSLLILLKDKKEIQKKEKYQENETLDSSQLKVYMTEKRKGKISLKAADIDNKQGIVLDSFNDTIADINRLEDRLLYEDDKDET